MRYPELGRLLTQMVKKLNAQHNRTMAGTMKELADELGVSPDTIYKWRRGKYKPEPSMLAKLVEIGVAKAGMERNWAERVLFRCQHPDQVALLRRLFPTKESSIRHNLPRRPYIRLVGREKELTSIRSRLTPESRHWLAPIEGVGGVGKSALALEIGWYFVENYDRLPPSRRFTAVIWVSAKQEWLTTRGIMPHRATFTNLDDVYRAIADVLEWPAIRRVSHEEQHHEVKKALQRAGEVLLILDNLETVDDPNVLHFLRDLPPPAKAITTMRFHEDMPYPIRLRELDQHAARELVDQECAARGLMLSQDQYERLLASTRGLPLAIWWAVRLMAMKGYGIEATLRQLANPSGDLQRFVFSEARIRLKERYPAAWEVLKTLTFFDLDSGATTDALAATVGLERLAVEQALKQLLNLNLINRQELGTRFTMLPLTRDFAQQEITPEWEMIARDQWSDHFRQYVEQYGDDDLGEGVSQESREKLRNEINNIRLAIEWSFEHKPTKAVRLVERITTFLLDEGHCSERLTLCERALEVATTPRSQAGLLTRLGWSYLLKGEYKQAQRTNHVGLRIAQQHGITGRSVQLLRDLGHCCSLQGQYVQASQYHTQSLSLAKEIKQDIGILEATRFQSKNAYRRGQHEKAKQYLLELLPLYHKSHPRQLVSALRVLGNIAISKGSLNEARNRLQEAEEHIQSSYYEAEEEALVYRSWGDLEKAAGNPTAARSFYQNALHLATRLGIRPEIEQLEQRIREIEHSIISNTKP